ncbi:MAG TPA: hypothetical protein PLD02_04240 [Saprospiraceae bacterium]|nr:hypothetical protein [Saprospiraceae bacterium]
MNLTESQMAILFSTGVNLKNAKVLADLISQDPTVGGIFPNGASGDLTPDEQKFKSKYCKWWNIVEPLLEMAKIFTPDKIDGVINILIELGNRLCKN